MSSALRVGFVDLETSHPDAFVPVIRSLGHEVTVVYDPSQMRGPDYAGRFGDRHGIDTVARTEHELAAACDVALLLGTDWDQHLTRLQSLGELGIPVLVDKPVAGRAADLRALAALDSTGPRVTGGSSLRTAEEVRAWRETGQRAVSVRATCAGPPFYYGVHAVTLAVGLLGEGLLAARSHSIDGTLAGQIEHTDGARIEIEVPHHLEGAGYRAELRTADGGLVSVEPAPDRLYGPYLDACLDYLGGLGPAPCSAGGLVEPELALLAMSWSAAHGGEWVALDDVPGGWHPWAGDAFADAYREKVAPQP